MDRRDERMDMEGVMGDYHGNNFKEANNVNTPDNNNIPDNNIDNMIIPESAETRWIDHSPSTPSDQIQMDPRGSDLVHQVLHVANEIRNGNEDADVTYDYPNRSSSRGNRNGNMIDSRNDQRNDHRNDAMMGAPSSNLDTLNHAASGYGVKKYSHKYGPNDNAYYGDGNEGDLSTPRTRRATKRSGNTQGSKAQGSTRGNGNQPTYGTNFSHNLSTGNHIPRIRVLTYSDDDANEQMSSVSMSEEAERDRDEYDEHGYEGEPDLSKEDCRLRPRRKRKTGQRYGCGGRCRRFFGRFFR
jgi:hypothetical protein